jgi:hypothetical protein
MATMPAASPWTNAGAARCQKVELVSIVFLVYPSEQLQAWQDIVTLLRESLPQALLVSIRPPLGDTEAPVASVRDQVDMLLSSFERAGLCCYPHRPGAANTTPAPTARRKNPLARVFSCRSTGLINA